MANTTEMEIQREGRRGGKVFLRYSRCPRCNGPMVFDPDFKEFYCGSWEYMEGGCPPAPVRRLDATNTVR